MEIIKKLAAKNADVYCGRQPVIACIGDSVTQGCFELYPVGSNALNTVFEAENSYPAILRKRLAEMFPACPTVVVNAGISGDNATQAVGRLERDVLSFKPDLVVICFGLNDFASGKAGLNSFTSSMRKMIVKCKEAGAEVIVMTPNDVSRKLSVHVVNDGYPFVTRSIEAVIAHANEGLLDLYVDGARQVAMEEGVVICDVYARWVRLREQGLDTTELLSNKINHPTREMNALTAEMLIGVMTEK